MPSWCRPMSKRAFISLARPAPSRGIWCLGARATNTVTRCGQPGRLFPLCHLGNPDTAMAPMLFKKAGAQNQGRSPNMFPITTRQAGTTGELHLKIARTAPRSCWFSMCRRDVQN